MLLLKRRYRRRHTFRILGLAFIIAVLFLMQAFPTPVHAGAPELQYISASSGVSETGEGDSVISDIVGISVAIIAVVILIVLIVIVVPRARRKK